MLDVIRSNPSITIREMQEATGLSESGVKKVLRRLREEGAITRVGADRGGYWKVV